MWKAGEATLRLWAATEARSLGRGGVTLVVKATGLSRTTIHAGSSEPNAPVAAGEHGVQLVSFKLFLLASLMNFTRSMLRILVSGRPCAYSPRSLDPRYRDWQKPKFQA